MAKFRCETPCYYNKRVWKKGEIIVANSLPNKHFKEVNTKYVKVEVEEGDDEPKTISEYQKKVQEETAKASGEEPAEAATGNFLE